MSKVWANLTLVGLALVGGLILSGVLAYYVAVFRSQLEFTVEAYAVSDSRSSAVALNVYNVGQLPITRLEVKLGDCCFAYSVCVEPGRSRSVVIAFDRPLVRGEEYPLTVTAYASNGAAKSETVRVKAP